MALFPWTKIAESEEFAGLNDQQKTQVFRGYSADMGQLPEWQELQQDQKNTVINGMMTEAGMMSPEPEQPSITEPLIGIAEDIARPFRQTGAIAAREFNLGTAHFAQQLDDFSKAIENPELGLTSGGAFADSAKTYLKNADYWDKRAKEIGGENVVSEITGAAAGGAVPGVAEFLLNVPYAAGKGAVEDGWEGAFKEAGSRAMLGKIFKSFQGLKKTLAVPAMSTVMAGETAAAGGSPEEVAKAAGVGALFGMAHAPGKKGVREVVADVKEAGLPRMTRTGRAVEQAENVVQPAPLPSPEAIAQREFTNRGRGIQDTQNIPQPRIPEVREAPLQESPVLRRTSIPEAEAPPRAAGEFSPEMKNSFGELIAEVEAIPMKKVKVTKGPRKGNYNTVRDDNAYTRFPWLQGRDTAHVVSTLRKASKGKKLTDGQQQTIDAVVDNLNRQAQPTARQETTGNLELGDRFTTITPEGKLDEVTVVRDDGNIKTLKDGVLFEVDSAFDKIPVVGEVNKPATTPAERGEMPIQGVAGSTRAVMDVLGQPKQLALPAPGPARMFETEPRQRGTIPEPGSREIVAKRDALPVGPMQQAAAPAAAEARPYPESTRSVSESIVQPEKTGIAQAGKTFIDRIRRVREEGGDFQEVNESMLDDLGRIKKNLVANLPGGMKEFNTMPTAENYYKLMRLTRGNIGRSDTFMDKPYDIASAKPLEGVRGFTEIVSDARNVGKLRDFSEYSTAKRALELEGRAIDSGMHKADAVRVTKAGDAKYKQLHADYVKFSQALLEQTMVKTGIITPEAFKKMQKSNMAYVPFQRHYETSTPQNSLMKITGSKRKIVDPLISTMQQTYRMVETATRNNALREFVDFNLKGDTGLVEPIRGKSLRLPKAGAVEENAVLEVAKQTGMSKQQAETLKPDSTHLAPDVISVWRNGEREVYRVNDPQLAEQLRMKRGGYQQAGLSMTGAALSAPTRIFRTGVTGTPKFLIRNLIRDPIAQAVLTRYGMTVPYSRMLRGLGHTAFNTETYKRFKRSGAEHSMLASLDRPKMERELAAVGRSPIGKFIRFFTPNEMMGFRPLGELGEKATRVGEFQAGLKAGDSPMGAGFESRDITIDFGKAGVEGRFLNQFISFLNPQAQGLTRTAQGLRESLDTDMLKLQGEAKEALSPEGYARRPRLANNVLAKGGAMITLPALVNWFRNEDNPIYNELPEEIKRQYFVFFPEKMSTAEWSAMDTVQKEEWISQNQPIAIQKPHELGQTFGTVAEKLMDFTKKDDPEALKNIWKALSSTVVRNVIPTVAVPPIEDAANHSFFKGRDLVADRYKGVLGQDQYTPHTTEIAKGVSNVMAALGIQKSPIILENYARGLAGTAAIDLAHLVDFAMDDNRPLDDADQTLRRLVDPTLLRVPSASATSINRFYDELEEATKFIGSVQQAKDERDFDKVESRYAMAHEAGYTEGTLKAIEDMASQISSRLEFVRRIATDDDLDMTDVEKKKEVGRAYLEMQEMTRNFNINLRESKRQIKAEQ